MGNSIVHHQQGFLDASFAGDLHDSKYVGRNVVHLCLAHCCASLLDVQKKKSGDNRSIAETEIVSLAAGLRKDGLPPLHLGCSLDILTNSSDKEALRTNEMERTEFFIS